MPSTVLTAFPIMKSLDLAILTKKLGSFQPNAIPTPPCEPTGTNCMSLVTFLYTFLLRGPGAIGCQWIRRLACNIDTTYLLPEGPT